MFGRVRMQGRTFTHRQRDAFSVGSDGALSQIDSLIDNLRRIQLQCDLVKQKLWNLFISILMTLGQIERHRIVIVIVFLYFSNVDASGRQFR